MAKTKILIPMKQKIKNWFIRYLPSEILGIVGAITFSYLASFFIESVLIIALVATWAGNLSFYGVMVFRDIKKSRGRHKKGRIRYGFFSFGKNIRDIFLEFGVAEVVDSFFVRPAVLFYLISSINNLQLGVLVGEIIADVIFYTIVILSYEMRKKHLTD